MPDRYPGSRKDCRKFGYYRYHYHKLNQRELSFGFSDRAHLLSSVQKKPKMKAMLSCPKVTYFASSRLSSATACRLVELKLKSGSIIARNEYGQIESDVSDIEVVPVLGFLLDLT